MHESMGGTLMNITVFHGGTSIIKTPLADVGRPNLDFGFGFYVTDIHQQAVDWAKRVSERRMQPPVINIYLLDRDSILNNYRCKVFSEYNGEWLDFIVESRLGKKPWAEFDYIEGGVANDRVIDTIELYMIGLITREIALDRLSEHRPNNQMCLLNQEIIDKHLIFHGAE